MYDQYTDRACRVLLEMRTEAFLLDHDHTGTEHLLIAIVQGNDDLTSPVLRRLGITTDTLRNEVKVLVDPRSGRGTGTWTVFRVGLDDEAQRGVGSPDSDRWPDSVTPPRKFTPQLLTCLMGLAPLEAQQLRDGHVGPEHLLLALLRDQEGVAIDALRILGVDRNELRNAVFERIAEEPGASDTTSRLPTEEERQAALEMRRRWATARMNPEDQVIFTSDAAAKVFCVLDGLDRLFGGASHDSTVEEVTMYIRDSIAMRSEERSDPPRGLDNRQIIASIVAHLRREAADQLGD
jgi:ATP-dependent Clp protease ATP-binding subunit ClpA